MSSVCILGTVPCLKDTISSQMHVPSEACLLAQVGTQKRLQKSSKVQVTKGSLSYLSSPCFSKNVLQSGVGIVH